ncbi:FG-GAP repeat [Carpediemonas membranifera]|uniref:FG-GAP repeat n=1 Tax=Carpediemonas membranifera TaxID=201153 RepID=A0A8J6E4Y5_9EUKA|nr:FG-GAP repeat [Carpediemonas membranifera]|eukprot:KAG9395092.1 FG-GAP repeat [Carpediemonas membranifera]
MAVGSITGPFIVLALSLLLASLQPSVAASSTAWTEIAEIKASDASSYSAFGFSVAADATTAIVGAYQSNKMGDDAGAAYIISLKNDHWQQTAELAGSGIAAQSAFGKAVDIDGDTVVVGAPHDTAVYVFVDVSGQWLQQAKIQAPGSAAGFGSSVAVSGDVLVIGAPQANAGRVFIFHRSAGVWMLNTTLSPPSESAGYFGAAVAFDSYSVAVGAHDSFSPGTVSVFIPRSGSWAVQSVVHAPSGHANDFFGGAVAVDGEHMLVGASHHSGDHSLSGAAYAFTRTGTVWTLKQTLEPDTVAEGQMLGASVCLCEAGAWIGMPGYAENQGAAVVFKLKQGRWTRTAMATATGGDVGDLFGFALAVGADVAFVGSYGIDDEAGRVLVFGPPTAPTAPGDGNNLPMSMLLLLGIAAFILVALVVVLLMIIAVGLALALIALTSLLPRGSSVHGDGEEALETLLSTAV